MSNENDTPTPQPGDNTITTNTETAVNPIPTTGPEDSTSTDSTSSSSEANSAVQSTGTEPTSTVPTDGEPSASEKKAPWFQRRIDQLTAEKWEERRAAESARKQTADLLAEMATLRSASVDKPSTPTAAVEAATPTPSRPVSTGREVSEAEINARAEQRAEQISREKAFNKACNDIAAAGKEEYGDFDMSLKTFQMLGGIPTQLLDTITEMPNAHKVLYSIGKDPDLAERIVKMPVAKQALELARLEANLSKTTPREVSKAPPPVRTIEATPRAVQDMEKMSMEDFIAAREKHLAAKRK